LWGIIFDKRSKIWYYRGVNYKKLFDVSEWINAPAVEPDAMVIKTRVQMLVVVG
jgi:hypothetical protein